MNDREHENSIRILIADDDEHILACYREAFSKSESTDYMKALDLLSAELFDPETEIVDEPQFEVVACSQGDDAVRCAKEAASSGHPFDVVILDVRMPPGIDGVEATRQLKGHPETPAIPVLAVTAYAMSADEDRMRAAGCDAYLTKPLRLADFVQVVQGLLAARGQPSA